jgi:disulfide bond formation protein DsbB
MRNPDPVTAQAMPARAARAESRLLGLALLMLALAVATILGALGFEHIGGYQPCALCLMQRTPYYVGIPVAAAAVVAVRAGAQRWLTALLFALFAALMLYGGGLAVYHSGVEWGIFAGPASCAPSVGVGDTADMLGQLEKHPPSCTEAAWRFLGLSFAGWNVIVSALLAGLGIYAAAGSARRG